MTIRLDDLNETAKLSESLSVIAIFVKLLRERFSDGSIFPSLPWIWRPDVATTDIFIESGWNENLEARNVRPGIWVERNQNIYSPVVIGDRACPPIDLKKTQEFFYAQGEMDIDIDCTSAKRGESMLLGSIVQDFVFMTRQVIMGHAGFHDISTTLLNKTQPFDKDNKLWTSVVQFRVRYEFTWMTQPYATRLQNIVLSAKNRTQTVVLNIDNREKTT